MCIYLSLCIFTLSLFLSFSLAHQNPFCLSEPKSLFSFSFCKPSPHLLYFSSPSVCSVSTYILSLSLFLFLPLSLSFYLYLYLYLFLSTLSISFFFLSLVQPFSFHSLYLFLSRTTFFFSFSLSLSLSDNLFLPLSLSLTFYLSFFFWTNWLWVSHCNLEDSLSNFGPGPIRRKQKNLFRTFFEACSSLKI